MRIPEVVQIGGHDYRVSVVEVVDPCEGLSGQSDHIAGTIRLKKALGHSQLEEVLLHECLHALTCELQIDLAEKDIHRLSEALYATLKRNRLWFGQGDPT